LPAFPHIVSHVSGGTGVGTGVGVPAGDWREVFSNPIDDVERVQRRFTENDGTWTWLQERLPAPVGGVRTW
jgi:hypothetical protein